MLKFQREMRGEADHCRPRLMKYCTGQGVDFGCGGVKIKPTAIGIDLGHPLADMKADARVLKEYKDGTFDYVFSSHLLEIIDNTEAVLREWLRIVKDGGNIVLYQADKEYYYPIGDPQCNPQHIHHFSWEDLWAIFQKIGGTQLIHHARFDPDHHEWSFELVVKKSANPPVPVDCSEGISFLVPTFKRPDAIEEFSVCIDMTTAHPENVEILFGVHEDDKPSIDKIEQIRPQLKISLRPVIIERDPQGVHLAFLWNQLYPKATYPIVGYFGDDVIFHTPGWDEEVRKEFLDSKSVLVSCNDVHIHRGKTSTLFFTHKSVHEALGFYLHPKFRRWYTDTFWDTVFRNAGKLRYREDLFTEHLSPDVFRDRADATYNAMEPLKGVDTPILNSREVQKQMVYFVHKLREMP